MRTDTDVRTLTQYENELVESRTITLCEIILCTPIFAQTMLYLIILLSRNANAQVNTCVMHAVCTRYVSCIYTALISGLSFRIGARTALKLQIT